MIKISPSMLAADFSALGEEAMRMQRAGADLLHVDVMDGHFVRNITIGLPVIKSLKKSTGLPLDVHLMIEKPERLLDDFIAAGADSITLHLESVDSNESLDSNEPADTIKSSEKLPSLLKKIRRAGVVPAVAIKPATAAETVFGLLDLVGMVLIMTVEPGFGGQKLIESTLEKVRAVRAECLSRGLDTDIEVDGGITAGNIGAVASKGANVFVSGSAIFSAADPARVIADMRLNAQAALV